MKRAISVTVLPFLLIAALAASVGAEQNPVRVVSPAEGEEVLGKIKVVVERADEENSYLLFTVGGKWTAQSTNEFELDTRQFKDGDLPIVIDYHDATGKKVATKTLTLKVSNKVPEGEAQIRQGEGLVFRHYVAADAVSPVVRRYLLTASARADAIEIEEESGARSEDDDGSAAAQVAGGLDIDIALLLRAEVKEVHGDGSAVVKCIAHSGSERVREAAQSGGGEGGEGGGMGGGMMGGGGEEGGGGGGAVGRVNKPPWLPWEWSSEVGKWTIKKITSSGYPMIATFQNHWPYQRRNRFELADITPAMPDHPVKPGDSWPVSAEPSRLPELYRESILRGYEGLDYIMRDGTGLLLPRAVIVPNLRSREPLQAIEEQKFLDVERLRWAAWEQGAVRMTSAVQREARVARLQSTIHLLPCERVQQHFRDMIDEGKPFNWSSDVDTEIKHDFCRQLNEAAGGTQGGEMGGGGGEMEGGGEMGGMGGGMMGGGGGGGGEGGESDEDKDPIKEIKRWDMHRFTYYDYENQRVLRVEDRINVVYVTDSLGGGGAGGEMGGMEGGMGGGMGGGMEGGMMGGMGGEGGEGGGGEGADQQAETQTQVTYRAWIITDLEAWPTRPTPIWDREWGEDLVTGAGGVDRFKTEREKRTAHDYDNIDERVQFQDQWFEHMPPSIDQRYPDL